MTENQTSALNIYLGYVGCETWQFQALPCFEQLSINWRFLNVKCYSVGVPQQSSKESMTTGGNTTFDVFCQQF